MIEVRETEVYADWFRRLRDERARARINIRIRRLSLGNRGDVKPVDEGISELRVDCGPGYRIYYVQTALPVCSFSAEATKEANRTTSSRRRPLARELKE
jgi:putative addiction module killer protein